ncbi:MAG: glucose-6-phosphate isomerase [Pirellulales bacterium]|nr:glucose-6-phosphate isomerase [Pirellulales bacterium]
MSPAAAIAPITYDNRHVFLPGAGLDRSWFAELAPRLEAARRETLDDVELWQRSVADSSVAIPAAKQPLDAGFINLPQRLLNEYRQRRDTSELGRIIATARRLADAADRIVVLGIGGSYMGARALFEALCHPYHNELPRGERGGRPRVYFDGNNFDTDGTAGLLDLVNTNGQGADPLDRWALVPISKSGGTLETAAAFRVFLRAFERANQAGRQAAIAGLLVPVTGATGKLRDLARSLGCTDVFDIPDGVGGRFSIFSAVGLLPAAVLGIDVVRLLEGAAAMNDRFQSAPPGNNPVLDYVATCHLAEERRGQTIRILSTWGKGLEAVGLWYDQLLSESLGKEEVGATPLTVVNTRDLHSRGQQHQEGRRDKLISNIVVKQPHRDALKIGTLPGDEDKLNALADKSLADCLAAAVAGTNQAYLDVGRPTADILLPRLDEASLGQLFQFFMLATVVEGRLIGINPYGQPGVEAYKKNMNRILQGK